MAVNTGAFTGVFFLGPGDTLIYGVLVILSGVGFGATLALPSAIQADVIDYDELKTGRRREGQYIGLWSIAKKLAAAIGVGVGLAVLGGVGYTPNADQSESVRLTLRVLYALVPSICNLLAICIALYYPISGDVHGRIRAAINRRQSGQSVTDPLQPAHTIG
jgi:GPH family glycoside/pentoside/hexuronide:cation symporter